MRELAGARGSTGKGIQFTVQRITGHRTTDIVLKHYFQPGKENFRRTLAGKLPALWGERSQASSEVRQVSPATGRLLFDGR